MVSCELMLGLVWLYLEKGFVVVVYLVNGFVFLLEVVYFRNGLWVGNGLCFFDVFGVEICGCYYGLGLFFVFDCCCVISYGVDLV